MKFSVLYLSFLMLAAVYLLFPSTCQSNSEINYEDLYTLGISDVIHIQVMGFSDYSVTVKVALDGTIAYPNLGTIYVKDKNLTEIEEEITRKLSDGYVNYPVVSVSLVLSESKKIFIHGEVNSGALLFQKDMSIIKALSISGGIGESARFGKIKVRRKGDNGSGYKTIIEAKISNGIIRDSRIEDTLLQPDDILIVERSETFFVQGQIKGGEYVLEDETTVSRVIALAGGIAESGLHGKLKIMRKKKGSAGHSIVAESSLDNGVLTNIEIEGFLLQSDDILKVEPSETIFVEGEVVQTGRYVLEHKMTVGRVITVAGGISEGGQHGKVKVRRKRIEGLGYDDIEIDITGIIEGTHTNDMLLQPDDILIVERSKTFIMYGEVNRIGEYPLEHDTTVFKAIIQAGGIGKFGTESEIKILRLAKNGIGLETIKVNIKKYLNGDVTADVRLEPGDIVVLSAAGLF